MLTRLRRGPTRAIGTIAVLATLTVACQSADQGPLQAATGGVLRVGVTGDLGRLESLNPMATNLFGSWLARQMVYPSLIQLNGADVKPAWAESWTASSDGRTYTFKLKKGAWSDGKPLTSDDALWTAEIILKHKDGAAGLVASALDGVKSVAAPDPDTFVVTYADPLPPTALSSLAYFSVLPKHVWSSHTGNGGKDLMSFHPEDKLPMVSGGPFTVTEFNPNGTTIFEPNKGYYGEPPKVDAVGLEVFENAEGLARALKSGDTLAWGYTDGPAIAKSVEGSKGVTIQRTPAQAVAMLNINTNPKKKDHPELKDVKVREAMSLAIDRKELIEVELNGFGQPGRSILVPSQDSYVPGTIAADAFDPVRANAILDELGHKRGADGIRVAKDGSRMEYELVVWELGRVAEILQKNLKAVGIALKPEITEEYTATVAAPDGKYLDFNLAFSYWSYLEPDPSLSLRIYMCDAWGSTNFAGYCDPKYDKLYAQQRVTLDVAERKTMIAQMQQMVLRDARATLPLYHPDGVHVISAKWAGIEPLRYGADLWTRARRNEG
ncbi:ABC transporter substrate-binding protein [Nonomuraea mangrovi]|uniref:ABC transporter substrate-binding protein n=1 Tax=Nonomuraea mangrovi TaxID=2316207 RepID=A0ABW4T7S3_9ACTN